MKNKTQKIGFGGGCHWCTEAIFQSLIGVSHVDQGFISSFDEFDSYSEAVIVHFDPEIIDQKTLIEIHLLTHKSTSEHSMRNKYRSAIYYLKPSNKIEIEEALKELQNNFTDPLITKTLAFRKFKESDEMFKDYFFSNPNKPFCERYIHPKLSMLLRDFSSVMNKEKLHHENNQTIHSK